MEARVDLKQSMERKGPRQQDKFNTQFSVVSGLRAVLLEHAMKIAMVASLACPGSDALQFSRMVTMLKQ